MKLNQNAAASIIFTEGGVYYEQRRNQLQNRDRFIQMGIAISSLRKMRGMSQEQLAEKASISRSHLSAIEAPNMVRAFSMEAFFNIADALDVTPEELIQIAFLQDKILKRKQ